MKVDKPTWKQMKLECLEKYKLDVTAFKKGNVPYDKICVFKCFYEKKGLMDFAGQFTLDKYINKHPKISKYTVAVIEDCLRTSQKDTPCESAKAIYECIKRKKVKKLH